MAALELTTEEKAELLDVAKAAELCDIRGAANDPSALLGVLVKLCTGDALPDPRIVAGVPAADWDAAIKEATLLVTPRDGDTPEVT
eukprot:1021970-Alexandrium_andersonii.AAC.1